MRQWLAPLDYVRVREIPVLLELWCKACPPQAAQVLDVASPQWLACHLARVRPEATVTYGNSFEPELEDLLARKAALGLSNVSARSLDARDADAMAAECFDAVISCSVLEHIHDLPTGPGDAQAMRNLALWLKPGGVLGLSVPFSRQAFEETKPEASYGNEEREGEPCFFQRFYDETTLRSRLIEPSGLEVEAMTFLGERHYHPNDIHRRLAARLCGRWAHLLLGWSFGLLTRYFMERSDDWRSLRKPYLVFVILRKA